MGLLRKIFGSANAAAAPAQPQQPAMTSREANEMLAKAVADNDLRRAEYALKATGSPNLYVDRGYYDGGYRQSHNLPMLWDAIANNRAEMVGLLLKYGADASFEYGRGNSALIFAANEGRTPIVRLLLDAGARLDAYNSGTALDHAKNRQYADIIKMLEQEPARRQEVFAAAQREKAEAEAKRLAEIEAAKQRAANPQPETEQVIKVMKPLSLKGAKKKGFFS